MFGKIKGGVSFFTKKTKVKMQSADEAAKDPAVKKQKEAQERLAKEQRKPKYNDSGDSAMRPFNFERRADYQWLPLSGYENLGLDEKINRYVHLAPWGREYTEHAIGSTLPSGNRFNTKKNTQDPSAKVNPKYKLDADPRSISPTFVEYIIGYGNPELDVKGRLSYTLGDVKVGVSEHGRVHHVKYKHGNKP